MPANKKLLILPGDGIGPEVMREVRRVIDWMDRRRKVSFDISDDLVGGASLDAGTPTPTRRCRSARHRCHPVRLGRRPNGTRYRFARMAICGCARNPTCSPICGRCADPLVACLAKFEVVRGPI
jgi:hypothetical protein